MEYPKQRAFTADEFIAWVLEQPEGRFELDNGLVVAMTPERVSHAARKARSGSRSARGSRRKASLRGAASARRQWPGLD